MATDAKHITKSELIKNVNELKKSNTSMEKENCRLKNKVDELFIQSHTYKHNLEDMAFWNRLPTKQIELVLVQSIEWV